MCSFREHEIVQEEVGNGKKKKKKKKKKK